MVKFFKENEQVFLSTVNKEGKQDGLSLTVSESDDSVEYQIALYKNGKQDGFLFTAHGANNFTLSLKAKNNVHHGPAFFKWKNAIEFVNLNENERNYEKSFIFFNDSNIQLDYNAPREDYRSVTLEKITHDLDISLTSFGYVDFTDAQIKEQFKNEITLNNGVKLIKKKDEIVLTIPEEGTENLFVVTLFSDGEVTMQFSKDEEHYYPYIYLAHDDGNDYLIYKTRNKDYTKVIDLATDGNLSVVEYTDDDEYSRDYEFNELLRKNRFEHVIGHDRYYDHYEIKNTGLFREKYFGMYNYARDGIGILTNTKEIDKYYLGEFKAGSPEGVGLIRTNREHVFCANYVNGKYNGPAIQLYESCIELKVFNEGRAVGTSYLFYGTGEMAYGTYDEQGVRRVYRYDQFRHDFKLNFDVESSFNLKFKNIRETVDGYFYAGESLSAINKNIRQSGVGYAEDSNTEIIGKFKNSKPYFGLAFNKKDNGYYLFNTYKLNANIEKPYFIIYPDLYTGDENAPTAVFCINDNKGELRYEFRLDRDGFFSISCLSNNPNKYVATYYLDEFPKEGTFTFGQDDLTPYAYKNKETTEEVKAQKQTEKSLSLDDLIGLTTIKEELKRLEAFVIKNPGEAMNMHMLFTGNPGTGKTEVARIIADIFHKHNILPTNKLIETDRSGLVDLYIGGTGPKTNKIVDEALGGVLFIDEAYALYVDDSPRDFGTEALATLLTRMENDRGKFVVIMAGYEKEMARMISSNPGLKSRFQYSFSFPDYTEEELKAIAKIFLNRKRYTIEEEALEIMIKSINYQRDDQDFANAREVRRTIESIIPIQNIRTINDFDDRLIIKEDVILYVQKFNLPDATKQETSKLALPSKELLIANKKTNVLQGKLRNEEIKNRVVAVFDGEGEGTGFLITKDGYGVTCEHCVRGGDDFKVKVLLNVDNREFTLDYDAKIVKKDVENDVAIFKLQTNDNNFYHFNLSEQKASVRDEVYLPGFIWGYTFLPSITVYEGKVVHEGEKYDSVDIMGKSGQSGSPIINQATNEVVGVFMGATARMIDRSYQEINHFMPIRHVWNLLEEAKAEEE